MSNVTNETAKFLSTVFVEKFVESAGIASGIFSVATFWMFLGERWRLFDVNRVRYN